MTPKELRAAGWKPRKGKYFEWTRNRHRIELGAFAPPVAFAHFLTFPKGVNRWVRGECIPVENVTGPEWYQPTLTLLGNEPFDETRTVREWALSPAGTP
jgi:hypothetical protein